MEYILDTFRQMDFSGIDGLLLLTALVFVVLTTVFLSAYWGVKNYAKTLRRIKGMVWKYKNKPKKPKRRPRILRRVKASHLIIPALLISAVIAQRMTDEIVLQSMTEDTITCHSPYIIDGDTFSCNNTRIRLYSIDAPEMPDHCREGRRCTSGDPYKSRNYLKSLTGGTVTCTPLKIDHYGRTIAKCEASGKDLSCEMVKSGHAVKRYGRLSCSD